jgi:hypothetical protein
MRIEQMIIPRKPLLVVARGKSWKTDELALVIAEAAKKLLAEGKRP